MSKYHLQLTGEEAALVERIDMNPSHRDHNIGHAAYVANQQPILELLEMLSERRAIPEQRLKWWNDQQYNQGRIKTSRKGLFERNGRKGADLYTHPHFIRHLRYFLYGTELPAAVATAFEERVGNPEWLTSSDVAPLGKYARELVRKANLDRTEAPEEFFKLCLDLGLGLSTSETIMAAVKAVR